MESILKNIISNALKYTPENGNVQIFVSDNSRLVERGSQGIQESEFRPTNKKIVQAPFPWQQCYQLQSNGKWYRSDACMEISPSAQRKDQSVKYRKPRIGYQNNIPQRQQTFPESTSGNSEQTAYRKRTTFRLHRLKFTKTHRRKRT